MSVFRQADGGAGMPRPLVAFRVLAVQLVHLGGGEGVVAEILTDRFKVVDQHGGARNQVRIAAGDAAEILPLQADGLEVRLALDPLDPAVPLLGAREEDVQAALAVRGERRLALPVGDRRFADDRFRNLVMRDSADLDVDGVQLEVGVHRGDGGRIHREGAGDHHAGFRPEQFRLILALGQVQVHDEHLLLLAGDVVLS